MMTPDEFYTQSMLELQQAMPDVVFDVVQLPGQKPHAHAVDRPDIEIVPVDGDPQNGRNYDAWQRPLESGVNTLVIDPSEVAYEVIPQPVKLSMTLAEVVLWLEGQLAAETA